MDQGEHPAQEVDSRTQSVEATEAEPEEQSINEEPESEVAAAENSGVQEHEEEEAGQDDDDQEDEEQEGIQSGQRSHREDVNQEEGAHEEEEGHEAEEGQEVEEEQQEMVDDEKENEGQQADDGARKNKKSDLDILLEKQNRERQRNRKKKCDSEELNEMDNVISGMIAEMKQVAAVSDRALVCVKEATRLRVMAFASPQNDRAANEKAMPGLKKLKLLPTVMTLLH